MCSNINTQPWRKKTTGNVLQRSRKIDRHFLWRKNSQGTLGSYVTTMRHYSIRMAKFMSSNISFCSASHRGEKKSTFSLPRTVIIVPLKTLCADFFHFLVHWTKFPWPSKSVFTLTLFLSCRDQIKKAVVVVMNEA